MKNNGFTLIELLVIIAIISILAAIVMGLLGPARLKAKDTSVASSLASYRTQAQLVFAGDFTGLCSSSSLSEIQAYIESLGGTLSSCNDGEYMYRIVAGLPSSFTMTIPATAYAAGEDGYCVNSLGESTKVSIAAMASTTAPSCSSPAAGSGSRSPSTTTTYGWMCSPVCSGGKCNVAAFQPTCYQKTSTLAAMAEASPVITQHTVDQSFCSNLPPITCDKISDGSAIPTKY